MRRPIKALHISNKKLYHSHIAENPSSGRRPSKRFIITLRTVLEPRSGLFDHPSRDRGPFKWSQTLEAVYIYPFEGLRPLEG